VYVVFCVYLVSENKHLHILPFLNGFWNKLRDYLENMFNARFSHCL